MAKITPNIYGLMASFSNAEDLVRAAGQVEKAGYRRYDAYSPFPLEDLTRAMRLKPSPLPFLILAGGAAGAIGGFAMQAYGTVIAYPQNIGGRPLLSWPAYIPISFELTILLAALAGVLGLFLVTRFPEPYHPVFNVEDFQKHGSRDGFFLAIEGRDPRFNLDETRKFLEDLGSQQIYEIEA